MKVMIIILSMAFGFYSKSSVAQGVELQQLILNLEKLNQLKSILNQMYKGYEIVSKGYSTIKNISQGNFSIHETFLNGLLSVSPIVKKYHRVAKVVSLQISMVKSCKESINSLKESKLFDLSELKYVESVFKNLIDRSIENLDELLLVISAKQLRMTDADRLTAVDRIYDQMSDKIMFLKSFNKRTYLLRNQRKYAKEQANNLNRLFLQK